MQLMTCRPSGSVDPIREFLRLNAGCNPFLGLWREGAATAGAQPALDIYEDKGELVIAAELPGVEKEDVAVTVERDVLKIRGEVKAAAQEGERNYYRAERRTGVLERSIQLPDEYAAESVKATFKNGVLEVRLQKLPEKQPRNIPIAVA